MYLFDLFWSLFSKLSSMNAGIDDLVKIDDEAKEQMINALHGDLDANENQQKLAELHFEAWMRQLDATVKPLKSAF